MLIKFRIGKIRTMFEILLKAKKKKKFSSKMYKNRHLFNGLHILKLIWYYLNFLK